MRKINYISAESNDVGPVEFSPTVGFAFVSWKFSFDSWITTVFCDRSQVGARAQDNQHDYAVNSAPKFRISVHIFRLNTITTMTLFIRG